MVLGSTLMVLENGEARGRSTPASFTLRVHLSLFVVELGGSRFDGERGGVDWVAHWKELLVKLYENAAAPNPRRVRIFLAEKGITVPTEQVDIMKRANREPEFRAKNPFAQVPVLELDDGTFIAESVAICRYFEELQPEPPLFGVGAKERALVEMWNRRAELELTQRVFFCFQNTHEFFEGRLTQVPEFGAVAKQRAEETLALLDGVLAERRFLGGDRFSIADITALVGVDFGRVVKIRPTPEQKNVARWHADVSARPSAKA
jgi:glutathione S-transferase